MINADNKTPLVISTTSLTNAGLIETTGKGHCKITSTMTNNGTLEANGGLIMVKDSVDGSGSAVISAGAIDFNAAFTQNVSFTGGSGKLELAPSQGYAGSISGFSKTGGTSLDLRDIGFVSSAEATFSGTATSGVLTVTDGTHTAHITLIGDYLSSTFVASSDGKGGTTVVDPPSGHAASAHRIIAAAAGLGARAAGTAGLAHDASQPRSAMLARPV